MNRMRGLAATLGVVVLIIVGLACADGETLASAAKDTSVGPPPAGTSGDTLAGSVPSAVQTPTDPTVSVGQPSAHGQMLVRPKSVAELVLRAEAIMMGTIDSVLGEKLIAPYSSSAPLEETDVFPVTDYRLRIEAVLKGDEGTDVALTLVLRQRGHLSAEHYRRGFSDTIPLPKPGDHRLFVLRRDPVGTYGAMHIMDIDGETVAHVDGEPFPGDLSPVQFLADIRDEVERQRGSAATSSDTGSTATSPPAVQVPQVDLRLTEKDSDTPGGNTIARQAENEPDTEPDVVRQDESAALATDIALTAKQTGLPVESVERAIAFQQAFGKYAEELIIRFPDQISAVWTEPVPNTRGHIRFIGEVPPELTSEIERQGLLDPNNVVLTGGGMISMADHARIAELAAEALADLGYRNFITFFDPISIAISVELQLPEGASQPSELDLVRAVKDRVRADRDQSGAARFQGRAVDVLDLELTVITGSGPIVTLEHGRGGV